MSRLFIREHRANIGRLVACSFGLMVFASMLVTGLWVGNAPRTVLVRALCGLCGGMAMAQLAFRVIDTVFQEAESRSGNQANQPSDSGGPSDGQVVAPGA